MRFSSLMDFLLNSTEGEVMQLDLQKKATELLKKQEGFRGRPYRCPAGKLTIGYGRNLDDNPLTQQEGEFLLQGDIAKAGEQLQHEFFWSKLDNTRKSVLISMVINMGYRGYFMFQKMRSALDRGDYNEAANQILASKMATQTGNRAASIAEMMRKGDE